MAVTRRSFLASAAAALTPWPARPGAAQTPAIAPHDSSFDPWIEVRADHLQQNAAEVARFAGGRPLFAVIKNNAYGLGLLPAARALSQAKAVRGLAVVKLHEALTLRDAAVKAPILMMGPFDARDVAEMHARDIMPMVYTPIGDVLARAAQGAGKPITVHVKIDTGLGRVGVPYRDAVDLVTDLASQKGVTIGGLMMTFTEDAKFDQEQLKRFESSPPISRRRA
jgi:alanine racemase